MIDLNNIRKQIDLIDDEIAKLLDKRIGLVSQVAKSKGESGKAVRDDRREKEILNRLIDGASDESREIIPTVYEAIFETSRKLQSEILKKRKGKCEKNFIVINGVNLDMLGLREPQLYGTGSYRDLVDMITAHAEKIGVEVDCRQSNHEGQIVEFIHECRNDCDGIIINAGAYTHTSIAILDALKAVHIPTVEVHITDINGREDYRKKSYISEYAEKIIVGMGFNGYIAALDYLNAK